MEHVVQFDGKRGTLPGLDMLAKARRKAGLSDFCRSAITGAAWLPSARVVRRSLKWGNERNPCLELHVSQGTAPQYGEEGGDDVKSAWPLCPGLHTCYNGRYSGLPSRKAELIPENRSKFGLGSATRPHEAGIASNRQSAMWR